MIWKGFLQESKSYMSYPDGGQGRFAEWNHISVIDDGWTKQERQAAKLKFWKGFPRACIKFHWACFCDWWHSRVLGFSRLVVNN